MRLSFDPGIPKRVVTRESTEGSACGLRVITDAGGVLDVTVTSRGQYEVTERQPGEATRIVAEGTIR